MASFETTGGGQIATGDKLITRKVLVSTGGGIPAPPGGPGALTNVNVTREAGGIVRASYEYTQGGSGDATYNQYGKKIVLSGGSREIPIEAHPMFRELTTKQILEVQEAVENREKDKQFDSEQQQKLYNYLSRKIEYYLVPSITAQVSEFESNLPSLSDLCTLETPAGLGNPKKSTWVLTGISANDVGDKYEVTREYTAIQDSKFAKELYG